MQEVQDEPLFAERVAGLDIAKAEVEVTIRVPQRHHFRAPAAGDPGLRHHPAHAVFKPIRDLLVDVVVPPATLVAGIVVPRIVRGLLRRRM